MSSPVASSDLAGPATDTARVNGPICAAEVALFNDALPGALTYRVPEALREQVIPGAVVVAPLRKRLVAGVVVAVSASGDAPAGYALRDLHAVAPVGNARHAGHADRVRSDRPALNPAQMQLARWMSAEYHAALGRCFALMVPPGLTPKSATVYALSEQMLARTSSAGASAPVGAESTHSDGTVPDLAGQIVAVLRRRGPLPASKLRAAVRAAMRAAMRHTQPGVLEQRAWRLALKRLVASGRVVAQDVATLQPGAGRPTRTAMAQLAVSPETLEIVLANLEADAARQPRRADALRRRADALRYLLARNGFAWADWISAETGANRADLVWLAKRNYVLLGDAERWRDPLADIDYVVKSPPPLTDDQQRAWDAIRAAMLASAASLADFSAPPLPGSSAPRLPLSPPPLGERVEPPIFLLRGVTGSGKTEIYMRAVELALAQGRGAIVLVPEISLTPQTARRFLERFPGRVALVHSRLKAGERYDTWRRIWAGELPVVVGARSALFAPLPDVGVIVIDEEHDPSYKQGASPYYHTRDVAMEYARIAGATLIMGSATPSLEMWRAALRMPSARPFEPAHDAAHDAAPIPVRLLELPNRVRGHANRVGDQQARLGVTTTARRETDAVLYQPLPDVQVVDMRAELRAGNMSMFSGALQVALGETLQRGEQAILFLNRRGAASCVICRDCGHVMRCPHDDSPLTYHHPIAQSSIANRQSPIAQSSILRCHQCDHTEPAPAVCPSCGSPRIRYVGIGTQRVESAIIEQFPQARVVRWDRDAAGAAGPSGADQMLQRFVNRQADVLIGTQMIAKGLDLPLVTLVGVVLADVGLFLPDFRASERVFDLIEQVAGRAGRGLLAGRVIVQTYNPEHPAIAYAARHDVAGFARYELAQRRMLNLPPFTRLVRFEVSDEDNAKARLACEMLARQLRRRAAQPEDVIGPAQAYFARRNNRYRWQVLARTASPRRLLEGLAEVMRATPGLVVDVDPLSVL